MNKTEYLLICLIEECAEIQQAATKALRFGLNNGHPSRRNTNADDIAKECCDLIAIIELLEEEKIINGMTNIQNIKHKKKKMKHYMNYSRGLGILI